MKNYYVALPVVVEAPNHEQAREAAGRASVAVWEHARSVPGVREGQGFLEAARACLDTLAAALPRLSEEELDALLGSESLEAVIDTLTDAASE